MKNKVQHCKKTKKYCYSSEAKATRAMNRYDDIKRIYYCDSCGYFHTTSMGVGLAIQEGIIEAPIEKTYSSKYIQQEIDKLQKKIDEQKL